MSQPNDFEAAWSAGEEVKPTPEFDAASQARAEILQAEGDEFVKAWAEEPAKEGAAA